MRIFAVITADVINSKKNQDIANIDRLTEISYRLNEALLKSGLGVLTGLTISRGDELQIVCDNLTNLPEITRLIRYYYFPIKLRMGIGIGVIDKYSEEEEESYITEKTSWQLNGEAFFAARYALDTIGDVKENTTFFSVYKKVHDDYSDDIQRNIESINIVYSLLDVIISRWTAKQWEYIMLYNHYGKDEIVAKVNKVTIQNVGKVKAKANWKEVIKAEGFIKELLEEISISAFFMNDF